MDEGLRRVELAPAPIEERLEVGKDADLVSLRGLPRDPSADAPHPFRAVRLPGLVGRVFESRAPDAGVEERAGHGVLVAGGAGRRIEPHPVLRDRAAEGRVDVVELQHLVREGHTLVHQSLIQVVGLQAVVGIARVEHARELVPALLGNEVHHQRRLALGIAAARFQDRFRRERRVHHVDDRHPVRVGDAHPVEQHLGVALAMEEQRAALAVGPVETRRPADVGGAGHAGDERDEG